MVHGKKRIPYWRDRRLNGLAGPEYHAIISFGLPIEPEDSQYGEYRLEIKALSEVIADPFIRSRMNRQGTEEKAKNENQNEN